MMLLLSPYLRHDHLGVIICIYKFMMFFFFFWVRVCVNILLVLLSLTWIMEFLSKLFGHHILFGTNTKFSITRS